MTSIPSSAELDLIDITPRDADAGGGPGGAGWKVLTMALALAIATVVGIVLVVGFVEEQRMLELRAWQTRLGIVAESRTTEVDRWLERQRQEVATLAGNATVQLFATELDLAGGSLSAVTDGEGQLEYVRNFLVVAAEQGGFVGPVIGPNVAANVERKAYNGLALYDRQGRPVVSTESMVLPDLRSDLRLEGAEPSAGRILDLTLDATGAPSLTFLAPVYSLQGGAVSGTELGYIVGVKQVAAELYPLLRQPGSLERSLEAVLLRAGENVVEYLSPAIDGTAPLSRSYAKDTPELAGAFALDTVGGFSEARDYRDVEVLITSRRLDNAPWVVAVKVDRAEALAVSETRLARLLAILLLAVALVAAALFAVWRHGASRRAEQAAALYRDSAIALEQQRNLLRLVTDSQPNSIFIVDDSGRVRFANRIAANQVGMDGHDLLGKSLDAIMGPAHAQRYLTKNRAALAQGDVVTNTARIDGEISERVLVTDHIPVTAGDDRNGSVLVVERDITGEVAERERRERALDCLIETLVGVVDRRDPYAAQHSQRVGALSRGVAEEMGLDDEACETARIAGTLLNLGKILVPESLLTRTTRLSSEELEQVQQGMSATAELLSGVEFSGPVVEVLRQVFERVDGSGAPRGLAGEEILIPAQIVAVANTFVGMISPRAHRPGFSRDQASAELMRLSGAAFDGKVVAALVNFVQNRTAQDWIAPQTGPGEAGPEESGPEESGPGA